MKSKLVPTIGLFSCGIVLATVLVGWIHKPVTVPADIGLAAGKALSLLQKSGYTFTNNSRQKCAGCHHTTLTSMAFEIAKRKGVPAVDSFATYRIKAMQKGLKFVGDPNRINEFLTANLAYPYTLLGLYAEKVPADFYTDLSVDYLISQERPGGGFLTESGRVPLETGDIHMAAMAIRAIQLYAAPSKKEIVAGLVLRTRQWLENTQTDQQQELVFQLLGLYWCGASLSQKSMVAEKLRNMQQEDGGWSQLPTMKSDAYATGQTLFALSECGVSKPDDKVFQKGLNYLLKTQEQSGAWIVETRTYPIQPFVNSDFPPYDENQFISATATNWAVMALLNALPDKKN